MKLTNKSDEYKHSPPWMTWNVRSVGIIKSSNDHSTLHSNFRDVCPFILGTLTCMLFTVGETVHIHSWGNRHIHVLTSRCK